MATTNSTGMYAIFKLKDKTIEGPSTSMKDAFEVESWGVSIYHPVGDANNGNSISLGAMQMSNVPITCRFHTSFLDLVGANAQKQDMSLTLSHIYSNDDANQTPKNGFTLQLNKIYLRDITFDFGHRGDGGRIETVRFTVGQKDFAGKIEGATEGPDGKAAPTKTFVWVTPQIAAPAA